MDASKILIYLGITALLMGLTLKYLPWMLSWFGKLPGDIRIQNQNSFVFIPVTSMIVVSLLLRIILNVFFRK